MPKRPKTSYFHFIEEKLEKMKSKYPDLPQSELQKKIADVIPPVIGKIAKCFSISENFEKLLNPIPGDFGSLNALRCFSMFWVIWGHTLFFWAQIGAANLGYAYNEFIHQFRQFLALHFPNF